MNIKHIIFGDGRVSGAPTLLEMMAEAWIEPPPSRISSEGGDGGASGVPPRNDDGGVC